MDKSVSASNLKLIINIIHSRVRVSVYVCVAFKDIEIVVLSVLYDFRHWQYSITARVWRFTLLDLHYPIYLYSSIYYSRYLIVSYHPSNIYPFFIHQFSAFDLVCITRVYVSNLIICCFVKLLLDHYSCSLNYMRVLCAFLVYYIDLSCLR